jgi:hypothetical protein
MKFAFRNLFFVCAAFLFIGCRTAVPQSTLKSAKIKPAFSKTNRIALAGKWHSVKIIPLRNVPEISACDKLNPVWWFENADEPVPPAWFKPGAKLRGLQWFARNPFHNFSRYVIGIADKKYIRSGRYPREISNPNSGWNFAVARRHCIPLPFVSYRRGKFEFYFGWRVRGDFGIKINFNPARTHPLKARGRSAANHLIAPSESSAPAASAP